MRVLFRKFYCPFICSFKSASSICSPCPLKLEEVQSVSSSPSLTNHISESKLCEEKTEAVKTDCDDGKTDFPLKSNLKKSPGSDSTEVRKGRVKWLDYTGKELVEIREFEDIESVDSDDNGNSSCLCAIQ